MKKNRIIMIPIILLALIVIIVMSILDKRTDSSDKTDNKDITNNLTEAEKKNAKIITFAVPDDCKVDEDNLQKFNEALGRDGYNYILKLKYLEFDNYAAALESELKNKGVDIAFLGLNDEKGNNNVYDLINSGLVLNLDEILSQKPGAVLYNAFPQKLWESVKCNGHIYSIPSALANDQGVYAAFNREYIADEDIQKWDGSIEGIYGIIKNAEWNSSDAPRFQYLINGYSFGDMIGCEIRNGLLLDNESQSIEKPLESEKFIGYLNVLDQMKKEGYMEDNISYIGNPGLNNAEVFKNIESGNYMVALSSGSVAEVFLKDNITVKKIEPYLSSRINGSIAISKTTADTADAVDFLGLLYGDEKYANILLYGQKDTDYKVMDGVVCNMDGTDLNDKYITKLCLNLFINIYPVRGESYIDNRRNEFFSFYDTVKLSPFAGFEFDTSGFDSISNDTAEFMNDLNGRTVDEAVIDAGGRLISDGIDEYLSSVKKQWKEYLQ